MGKLIIWSACLLIVLNILNYSVGQPEPQVDVTEVPATCGLTRKVHRNDAFTINNEIFIDQTSQLLQLRNRIRKYHKNIPGEAGHNQGSEQGPPPRSFPRTYQRGNDYFPPRRDDVQARNLHGPQQPSIQRSNRPSPFFKVDGKHRGPYRSSNVPYNPSYKPPPYQPFTNYVRSPNPGWRNQRPRPRPRPKDYRNDFMHVNPPSALSEKPTRKSTLAPKSFAEHIKARYSNDQDERRKFPNVPQLLLPKYEDDDDQPKYTPKADIVNFRRSDESDIPRAVVPDEEGVHINPKHTHTTKFDGNGKLPIFIEHLIDSERKKQAVPKKAEANKVQSTKANPPLSHILESLGPEKLEQLRSLLNTAAGPYGAGSEEISNTQMLQTVRDQDRGRDRDDEQAHDPHQEHQEHQDAPRPRYRMKRDATIYYPRGRNQPSVFRPALPKYGERRDLLTNNPDMCSWIFQKASECRKLVLNLEYSSEGPRDCSKEFLRITSGNGIESIICEINNAGTRQFSSHDKITIEYYRFSGAAPSAITKFKGALMCA